VAFLALKSSLQSQTLVTSHFTSHPRCCEPSEYCHLAIARYNEIAERAHQVQQKQSGTAAPPPEPVPFTLALGQELYRTALFAVFFVQILAARLVPYVGALKLRHAGGFCAPNLQHCNVSGHGGNQVQSVLKMLC